MIGWLVVLFRFVCYLVCCDISCYVGFIACWLLLLWLVV